MWWLEKRSFFAVEEGFLDIVLEGNNMVVMQSLRSNDDGLASGGTMVVDMIYLRALCNILDFSFVKREGNSVAHSFAKFARMISNYVVWLEDRPLWVEELLYSNVSFLP